MMLVESMVGQRYSRLVVTELAGRANGRQYLIRCQCDCGEITVARADAVRQGRVKSCGCYRVELARTKRAKPVAAAPPDMV